MKNISKSQFLIYNTCPKLLWLLLNKPELNEGEVDQKHIEEGKLVGSYAKRYFKDMADATSYKENDELDIANMIGLTNRFLLEGKEVIAEASFSNNGLFCSVDLLKAVDGGYEIYEVKATTKVKAEHLLDAAFQKYVLEKRGLNVVGTFIMHLNKEYLRDGDIDVEKMFVVENAEKKKNFLKFYNAIEMLIPEVKSTLSAKNEPSMLFNGNCKECSYHNYCFRNLPNPNITNICDLKGSFEYLNQGIITYLDALANHLCDSDKRQLAQIEAYLHNKELLVDKEGIKSFLKTIRYPLYHLDFESVMFAVPPCDGAWPYEQIPTQYSLHIEYEDGHLEHKEFLGESIDPRRAIAESLCKDIPEDACILAYNKTFECGRLKELAELFPDLSEHLLKMVDNVVDLLSPFRDGYYYNAKMGGSNSIKAVLPALYPNDKELDYHTLSVVHNGSEAMDIYPKMLKATSEEKERIRQGLLQYCCLDTLAMVKVLRKLKESIE